MRATWVFTAVTLLLIAGALVAPFYVTPLKVLLVTEGCIVVILILMSVLYRSLIRPVSALINGVDLLREQDFSSRLSPVGQRDADRIVEMFNGMMSSLKEERLHVREQNHFLDLLIAASPMGIMILDDHDRVMMANGAALRFLEIDTLDMVVGRKISDLEGGLAEAIVGVSQGETTTLRLSDAMVYRCSRLSFMDKGYAHPFIMIEKLTDEVMKAEKLAYEKVIRMMAHEVNNSMGGVGSVLDTAASVTDDPDMAEALEMCRRRCESMSRFITSFADVVKIPQPQREQCDLNIFLSDTLPLLESLCTGRDISLCFESAPGEVNVMIDRVLMEQVMINLVKNAVESIGRGGVITISATSSPAGICVADNGAGIDKVTQQKIFTPFFSSKADGRGLGLLFISEVLNRHDCTFSLRTDKDGLTRFTIRF